MAEVNKEIALKVTTDLGQTTAQFKNANEELKKTQRALVELALAGKQGSKEFREMEKRAAELTDQIGDVRARVNALASDTPKLDLLAGAATGIAGGFAAAQGAAALFGGENEDVQKAILKTQGAMSLLNGVQQIANTLNKDSVVGMKLAALSQKAYALAVGTSTGAMKLFRLALIATGVGAFVVLIGALVANFDKLSGAVMSFINSSPTLTKIITFLTDGFNSLGRAVGIIPSAMEDATKQMIADLEKQEKLLEAAGADSYAIQKRLAELRVQLAIETGEGLEEAEQALVLMTAKTEKQKADARAKAQQDRVAREIQTIESEKALAALRGEELFGYDFRLANKRIQLANLTKTGIAKAESDLTLLVAGYRQSELNSLNLMLSEMETSRAAARAKEVEQADAAHIATMQADASRRERLSAQEKHFAEIKLADEEKLNALKYNLALGGFQAIADLVATFAGQSEQAQERAFNVQKAASIAQTVLETITSASKAFNSLSGIPFVGVGLGIAAAAVATASGLARIAAIRRTNYQSASSSIVSPLRPAGTSGGAGTPPPTGFSPNQGTPIVPPPAGSTGGVTGGAQRVFVLERDISRTARRVQSVERFATFGT